MLRHNLRERQKAPEYFLEKLREKLKDPEFREIEGFPMGEDDDILALSDPPYYTVCPNPFIEDFIRQYGKPYDLALKAKAKDRWYVPDPNKADDLKKLRERALMREFEEYRESKQKRLKVFRLEAVRAGFKKAWQERDYATIIAVARKIPDKILQEDPKLLMWYDQAITRMDRKS